MASLYHQQKDIARNMSNEVARQILDLARWAPSGDNSQPWRFEIVDDRHIIVYGFDTRDHCIYDLCGHGSQISLGALLENITIAASEHHLRASIVRRTDTLESRPTFDVRLSQGAQPDSLARYLKERCVQRRPLQVRRLSADQKRELEGSLHSQYRILWFEGLRAKASFAKLLYLNAGLRLTLPEAYGTHRNAIEWDTDFSESGIPDRALGASFVTLKAMRWAMTSWARVRMMNRYFAGTIVPRIEMDLIPALACGAHFVLVRNEEPQCMDDYVDIGKNVQRFWLVATRIGLHVQPQMTPLVFGAYLRHGIQFTAVTRMREKAEAVSSYLQKVLGSQRTTNAVFMGRIGAGRPATHRSVRKPLPKLLVSSQSDIVQESLPVNQPPSLLS